MISGTARSSTITNVTDFQRSLVWTFKSRRPGIRTDIPAASVYLAGGGDRSCGSHSGCRVLLRIRQVPHSVSSIAQLTVHSGMANGPVYLVALSVDRVDRFALLCLMSQ